MRLTTWALVLPCAILGGLACNRHGVQTYVPVNGEVVGTPIPRAASTSRTGSTMAQPDSTTTPAEPPSFGPDALDMGAADDAQLAGIVEAIHKAEVEQAEAGLSRATAAEVQALARDSLEGHHDDAGEDQTVFAQLGLRPVHSTIATQALDESRRAVAALQAESAVDFDRTFVDQQVELDRWAAKALDAVIGKVGTLQLRRLFERQRAAVAGHLRKAEELQKRMQPPTQ